MASQQLAEVAVLCLFAASCGGDAAECLALPCALPIAVTITVTSSAMGTPVSGAFVQEGALNGRGLCSPTTGFCQVFGGAGTYQLDIGAPGFQTVHRAVSVSSSSRCGCGVNLQHLDVALVPAL